MKEKPTILMVGPGKAGKGGILSLVNSMFDELAKVSNVIYFQTILSEREPKDSGVLSVRNIYYGFSQFIRFVFFYIKYKPDIVHIHTSERIAWLKDSIYVMLSKLFGSKVILHVHAADVEKFVKSNSFFYGTYASWILTISDVVIALSDSWGNSLRKLVPGINIVVLHNCVNVTLFEPGRGRKDVDAIFVGSIGARKGLWDLLKVIMLLKSDGYNFRVWIAGGEEYSGTMLKTKELIQAYGIEEECKLLGLLDEKSIREALKKAYFLVLPSYNEGMPIAILEGIASGLPIVSTNVGGIPALVQNGVNGFLIEPGDIAQLGSSCKTLFTNKDLCLQMGRASREKAVRDFNVDNYISKLKAIYTSLFSLKEKA